MVEGMNGTLEQPRTLPAVVKLSSADAARVPSPGTLRELKAQTGKGWDELMGPDADPADRFQTSIWSKLRRDIPGLRWDECADVELEIHEVAPDPLGDGASAPSPPSAASGV